MNNKKISSLFFLFCLLITSLIVLVGCSEVKKTRVLTFTPTYKSEILNCLTSFKHEEKTWQYSQLQFFISNIEVKAHDGQWQVWQLSETKYQTENVALLGEYCQGSEIKNQNNAKVSEINTNIEQISKQKNDKTNQGNWQLLFEQPQELSNFSQLRFTLGVPFSLNHQNPLLQKSPLNVPNMFWVWQTGHKFFRLDMEEVNENSKKDSWQFHLGSTGCKAPSALRAPKQPCENANLATITLDLDGTYLKRKEFGGNQLSGIHLDLAELFSGLVITQENSCQSGPYSESCLPLFKDVGLVEGKNQRIFMLSKTGIDSKLNK